MSEVGEVRYSQNPLKAALDAGIDVISQDATITFTKYLKTVLPLDGFVFWVSAALVNPSAVINAPASPLNTWAANAARIVGIPPRLFDWPPSPIGKFIAGSSIIGGTPGMQPGSAAVITAAGSIHYSTRKEQREDETLGINQVVFTSEVELQDLNEVSPTVMFIGQFQGKRFAFSQRQSFYLEAEEWHYVGDAVYPAMESQIIDAADGIDIASLVVTNSLPFWLQLSAKAPFPKDPVPFPLYPSFAVPENIPPPYGVIHIPPEATEPLAPQPFIDSKQNHWQLAADNVKVTLYGRRNSEALAFYDTVMAVFEDGSQMGLLGTPVMRDAKRVQAELGILAMKKEIEFRVSYFQYAAVNLARQLITDAFVPDYTITRALVP